MGLDVHPVNKPIAVDTSIFYVILHIQIQGNDAQKLLCYITNVLYLDNPTLTMIIMCN
ncbi:hypothetical protein BTGOE5_56730 [Bacillus thuringiensis]|nr:hypothetical protein IIS_04803 [Bacillus cereus VD131]MCS3600381.1 hypothetical protein [Bacillus sp. JUb91]OFC90951.1 hypothetical protein BTGOE5_56730 [Bacillus thuringiensis]